MDSVFVKGTYVSGFGHSKYRPRLYEALGLWQGTINIQLPGETDERFLIPDKRLSFELSHVLEARMASISPVLPRIWPAGPKVNP